MSQSALRVLSSSNPVAFGGREDIVEKPWFLQQYAPTLDLPGARLKLVQITQKLGPDNQKIKAVRCQPGFFFNIFICYSFHFSFDFHYNWHLLFRFFPMRSHQVVECPTLASFQPSEFNICLCQRENGAFSYSYFSFHWWKENLWFTGRCAIFYYSSWYSWRKRQAFEYPSPLKYKLMRKNFAPRLIHIK